MGRIGRSLALLGKSDETGHSGLRHAQHFSLLSRCIRHRQIALPAVSVSKNVVRWSIWWLLLSSITTGSFRYGMLFHEIPLIPTIGILEWCRYWCAVNNVSLIGLIRITPWQHQSALKPLLRLLFFLSLQCKLLLTSKPQTWQKVWGTRFGINYQFK